MTELDTMLREAAPYADEELDGLDLGAAEAELRAAIVARRAPRRRRRAAIVARRAPRRRRRAAIVARRAPRRRRRAAIVAWTRRTPRRRHVRRWSGLAVATAVAMVVIVASLGGGGDRLAERAWAAPALRVANAVPRLLVGEPAWRVERADQFTVDEGEMTFSNGERTLDLHWRTGQHAGWVKDRAMSGTRQPDVEVLGATARVFRYDGSRDDFTALWRHGRYTMELRVGYEPGAPALTFAHFRSVLGSLEEVGVDAWLSAMPESVVLPAESESAVAEMLEDMPVPEGFDASALDSEASVRDRYQLGARVAGAVACAWIEQWVDGDAAARQEAVAAMQTSRDWAILDEMNAAGDYPEVLWEFAHAMESGGTVPGGRPLAVEEAYEEALGC